MAEAALHFARLNLAEDGQKRDIAPYLRHLDDLADQLRAELARITLQPDFVTLSDIAGLPVDDKEAEPTIEQVVKGLQTVIAERNGFQGDMENYDDMANADLLQVIERKRGLPVALGLLYIHAAERCGITITGIDFPGHFLLRVQANGKRRMIDPFHGGITLGPAELRELLKSFSGLDAELEPRHYRPTSNIDILLRLQNNIKVRALRAGELALATRVIEHSLLIAPDHEGLWHQLGALYARLDQDHMALGAFEQFVMRCDDPLHRARIEAVIEELRERLEREVANHDDPTGISAPSESSDQSHSDPQQKSNAPIPLFPDLNS
ncbi:transglutaminase-like domain-containing protein [uncultured Thalassospira sp.]|uniref:SirB1 family protein n=1 Tax=uncultured Thalassospira sp. TaxID=404382 RepID=UPI00258C56B6|nr:transglutaminase-like domain-containing protein [uncultured Thalassospira sp.]